MICKSNSYSKIQNNISYAFQKKLKDYLKEQILKYLRYIFRNTSQHELYSSHVTRGFLLTRSVPIVIAIYHQPGFSNEIKGIPAFHHHFWGCRHWTKSMDNCFKCCWFVIVLVLPRGMLLPTIMLSLIKQTHAPL